MSGFTIRSIRQLGAKRSVRAIAYLIVGAVALSMIIFFTLPGGAPSQRGEGELPFEDNTPVAVAAGKTITAGEMNRLIANIQQQQRFGSGPGVMMMMRYQAIQSLANEAVMEKALREQGISVSNDELEKAKEQFIQQQLAPMRMQILPEGKGTDADFDKALRERGGSLSMLKERMLAMVPESSMRVQAMYQKWLAGLKQKFTPANEDQLKQMWLNVFPARIWINTTQQRDKEAARKRAQEAYDKLKGGAKFEDIAKQYTDDPATIRDKGGHMTGSGYYEIQDSLAAILKPEDVSKVMALNPGQYTEPMEDKEGKSFYIYSIIKRQMDLPKDFEQKKDDYKQQYIDMRTQSEVGRFRMQATTGMKTEYKDPLLQAYNQWVSSTAADNAARMKNLKEILEKITPLTAQEDNPDLIYAQWLHVQILNQLYSVAKQVKDKKLEQDYRDQLIASFEKFFSLNPEEDLGLRLTYGELLLEAGKKEKAVEEFKIVQEFTFEDAQFQTQQRLAELFKKAGENALAAKAAKQGQEMFQRVQQQQMEQQRMQAEMMKQYELEQKKKDEAVKKAAEAEKKKQQQQKKTGE